MRWISWQIVLVYSLGWFCCPRLALAITAIVAGCWWQQPIDCESKQVFLAFFTCCWLAIAAILGAI